MLVVLLGPTAVGKTALAIRLAQQLSAHVLSADSRQLYLGLDIGTGKPTLAERGGVPHHFIDHLDADQAYHAGAFADEALALLDVLFAESPIHFLAGGTGFYVKALLEGMDDLPEVTPALRAEVQAVFDKNGLAPLLEELHAADPATWQRIDRQNPARVKRAVELLRAGDGPVSELRKGAKRSLPFATQVFGLNLDRATLHHRIDTRVQGMFAAGLVDEVRGLLERYGESAPGLQSIGYTEVMAHLRGEIGLAECTRQVQAHTRQYARRQLTWMRRVPGLVWLDAADPDQAEREILERLRPTT
jgi:tRNA dimethylallyltransferase